STSAWRIQFVRQDSEIPKSFAIWESFWPGSRFLATRTTSSRNSWGYGAGMVHILPCDAAQRYRSCDTYPRISPACARRCVHHHTSPTPGDDGEGLGIVAGTVHAAGPCLRGLPTDAQIPPEDLVTEQPADTAPRMRVAVYGSCVARDTVDLAGTDHFDVVAYVARQSLLSADHDASAHFPAQS